MRFKRRFFFSIRHQDQALGHWKDSDSTYGKFEALLWKGAMSDDDQYKIRRILDYQGDPDKRSSMRFLVEFEDLDLVWVNYNPDLTSTVQFERFVHDQPQLLPLRENLEQWTKSRKEINAQPIQGVSPGDRCYVDLRAWGSDFFNTLSLPRVPNSRYVVECRYTRWTTSKRKKIDLECPLFRQKFDWSHVDVKDVWHGSSSEGDDAI